MPSAFELNANVNLNSASVNASAKQIQQALGRITGQASEFQKSLDASTARVFAFGATTAVLNGVNQAFKKLVATTIEVQKKLVEINSIFQATNATFNRFRNSIFQVAKDTGQAFNTVAEGAAELARQGLSAEETAKRLKAALILTRISGLDAEKSVKALTAAINGFASAGLNANQIVNKMVAVDTAFAVSAQDLAEAFSRAGSTAEDAGVSFNELLGLVTAVEQRTARGGAVIGNAFKSIFTRLARGNTIDQLRELGVEIDATQTGIQKLQALSKALESIADPTKASAIKELAGGVFQINVVSAALKDLSSETGIFAQAAVVASKATNEAFQKNAALNETLAAQINTLVVGLTSLAEKIGKVTFGPLLENLLGLANKFTEFLDKALDPEKGNTFIKGLFKAIGAFLGGPAVVVFTAAFIKIFALVAKFAKDGLKAVFQIGSQTQKLQGIEAGLVQLLSRDSELRKIIQSTTTSQAIKEQAIITAIQRENALLTQQAAIMRSLASAAAARGVSGFGQGGFTGKGGKKFNAGFRAEEAEARMRGAPSDVRGRYSQGTIGGQRFIMNSHETEVPRFGSNGDSAVIPHYSGGFIPNYAAKFNPFTRVNADRKWFNSDGTFKSAKSQRRYDAADEDTKKAFDAIRPNAGGAAKGPQKPAPIVMEGGTKNRAAAAFMSPTGKGAISMEKGIYKKGNIPYHWQLKSSFQQFSPSLKKINPDSLMSAASASRQNLATDLEERAFDAATGMGVTYAQQLQMPKGKANLADDKSVRKRLEQGTGNKGAYGAIRGLAGAAFEAAIYAALDLTEYSSKTRTKSDKAIGGDFDIEQGHINENPIIRELFGLKKGYHRGDLKIGATEGPVNSFAAKILKNSTKEKDYKKKWQAYKAAGGKAAGFIPNFARGRGVPTSKIRLHDDANGETRLVTNINDEPRGVQDAIKREKEGIGMFAGGFVPNYAKMPKIRKGATFAGPQATLNEKMQAATANRQKSLVSDEVLERGKKMLAKVYEEQATHGKISKKTQKELDKQLKKNTKARAASQKAVEASTKKTKAAAQGGGTGGKGGKGGKGDGMGGMGVMMAFGGLQMAAGQLEASLMQDITAAEASREQRIKEIDDMDLSVNARQAAVEALDAEIQAVREGSSATMNFTAAVSKATTVLMAMSALNMVTGGSLGKMGKGIGGMFGSVAKGGGMTMGAGAMGAGAMGAGGAAASVLGIVVGLGIGLHDLTKAVSGATDETILYQKVLGGSDGAFQGFFDDLFGVGKKAQAQEAQRGRVFAGKTSLSGVQQQFMGGKNADDLGGLELKVDKSQMEAMIARYEQGAKEATDPEVAKSQTKSAAILKERVKNEDFRFTGDLAKQEISDRAVQKTGKWERKKGFGNWLLNRGEIKTDSTAGPKAVLEAERQVVAGGFGTEAGADISKKKRDQLAAAYDTANAILINGNSTETDKKNALIGYRKAILGITDRLLMDADASDKFKKALDGLTRTIDWEKDKRVRAMSAVEKARKGRDESFQKADLRHELVSQLDVPEGPAGETMRFVQGVERSKLAGEQAQAPIADLNKDLAIAQAAAAKAQGVEIDKGGEITSLALEGGVGGKGMTRIKGSLDRRGLQITSEDIDGIKDKIETKQNELNKILLKTQADLTNAVKSLPKEIAEAEKAGKETRGKAFGDSLATLGRIEKAPNATKVFKEAQERLKAAREAEPTAGDRNPDIQAKQQARIDSEVIAAMKALDKAATAGDEAGGGTFFRREIGTMMDNPAMQKDIATIQGRAAEALGGAEAGSMEARFLEDAFKPQKTAIEKNTDQLETLNNRLDYAAGELGLKVDRTGKDGPTVDTTDIGKGKGEKGTFSALFNDTKLMVGVTLGSIAQMAGDVTTLQEGVAQGNAKFNTLVTKVGDLNVAASKLFTASEGKLKELATTIAEIDVRLSAAEGEKSKVEEQLKGAQIAEGSRDEKS